MQPLLRTRSRRQFTAVLGSLAIIAASLAAATTAPATAAPAAADCPWVGSSAPIEERVASVLTRMTLDEKIMMVHGGYNPSYTGYVPGNPRLCIPALKLQDGPVGLRMSDTTQLPAAVDLAASFGTGLSRSYGAVIGSEARTKGVDVDLGPTVNIVRDPRWGRAFESYSEDPYLTGQVGSAVIEGIQNKGVMAQVKHYAVYNQETNRNTPADDALISDRTVREIYTAQFRMIVEQSNPSSTMCGYSLINGVFDCENAYINNILKNDYGFRGFITSDWFATHSTVESANAGMDMQMPDDSFFGEPLKQAVLDGRLPLARLDDMVTRILRAEFRFDLFDHPSPDTPAAPAATPGHIATARRAAEQGAVLLKNSSHALPFNARQLHSVAVIGEGAGEDTMSHGGGSAGVDGTGTVTPFEGIKDRAGPGVDVQYAQGNFGENSYPVIDSQYFTPPTGNGHGLQGEYYSNASLSGSPTVTRTDPDVDYSWDIGSPAPGVPSDNFSVKWTGTLTPPETGTYTFGLTSDDGSRLIINGQELIDNWRDQGPTTETAQVDLTAGQPVDVEVDYYEAGGGAMVNLGWRVPGAAALLLERAVQLARNSDVAVVYANKFESEGADLDDIDLPSVQNRLINAVAAANPDTIVVLNTGSAVTMPWLERVKSVIEAWYPGQQSGNAIAALLFGDVNPSGKLPVTFPKSLDQVPAHTPERWPGVDGKVHYSEGLQVGYRWYDEQRLTPMFPFGYGLSYTSFRFSHLSLSSHTLSASGAIDVRFRVTNAGRRAGAEVAQLYLTDPRDTGEPGRQLRGFSKVFLHPGQTKTVRLRLRPQDGAYWDTAKQRWTLRAGTYSVQVGDSSRSLPLSTTFTVASTTDVAM
jgi:beta-glucosidase